MKMLLLICFFPLQIVAQDLTGIWTGSIQTTGNHLSYEVVVSENKEKLTGYALTVFVFNGVENVGIKSIQLKIKEGSITIEDGELVYHNYTAPAKRSKLSGKLTLGTSDSTMVLSGSFTTRSLDFRDQTSYTGTIYLQKQNNFTSTRLTSKLDELNLLNSLSFVQPVKQRQDMALVTTSAQSTQKEKLTAPKPEVKPKIIEPTVAKEQTMEPVPLPAPKDLQKQISLSPKQFPATNIRSITTSRRKNIVTIMPALVIAGEIIPQPTAKEKQKQIAFVHKQKPATDIRAVAVTRPKNIVNIKTVEKPVVPAMPVAAVAIAERKTEVIREVFFQSDSLVLSLYDNGTIDGDTVSVVLNGKVIIARKGLTANAIRTVIPVSPDLGDSLQLIMYAENLGSIPPNTGLLIVQDGENRNEIRFAGDLQKSSAVILRRRK